MAAPVPDLGSNVLVSHVGPWTEQEFLALPDDWSHIELLGGALLMSPLPGHRHQRLSFRLAVALDGVVPAGYEVLESVNVRIRPGTILGPDVVVTTNPGADVVTAEAADIALAVEISSPGSIAVDRAVKPQLYAQAGIPNYLHVEFERAGPSARVYRLVGDQYVEVARVAPGERLVLAEPFPVTLDLAALASATRPVGGAAAPPDG